MPDTSSKTESSGCPVDTGAASADRHGAEDFRRALGPWSAGALVAGTIIGTGIFLFVSEVANAVRTPGLILSAWITGGIIALVGAFCLAELSATYPQTGGIYVYLRRAFGPLVGFEYAWAQYLIMFVGSYCIQCTAFAQFMSEFLGIEVNQLAVALCVLWGITIINIIGVKQGSRFQNVLTLVKILSVILLIGVGLAFGAGLLHAHPIAQVTKPQPMSDPLIVLFGLALIAVMYTFSGWDQSPYVAEEVINPERNLPLSIMGGLLLCGVLFLLANIAYMAVLTPAEFAAPGGKAAPMLLQRALGPWAGKALSLVLMISTLGAANALILTSARVAFASGRDNPVFSWFAKTHPVTKTPVRSLIIQACIGTAAIACLKSPFQLLLYTGFAWWVFASLLPIALIVLRNREPEVKRPFRVALYPFTPILFCLGSLGMVFSCIANDGKRLLEPAKWFTAQPPNVVVSVAILAVGAAVYAVQKCIRGNRDRHS